MSDLAIYQGKTEPKSVTLKIGKWYDKTDGTKVLVYGIRTNGDQTQVYYKYPYSKKHWYTSTKWSMCSDTIQDFKAKLLDLGMIDEVLLKPMRN